MIRLSAEAEPEIYRTTHTFGTILENVAVDERGVLDLDDDVEDREHARRLQARADLERAPDEAGRPPEPVIFLTADAFGILPPIARLTRDAGALLLPLRLHGEARGHRDRRHRAAADVLDLLRRARSCRSRPRSTRGCSARSSIGTAPTVWLVNTGWTGGPFGEATGCRSPATRALLRAALSGELGGGEFRADAVFGFEVPVAVPGVDAKLLDPRSTWRDPEAYDRKARELAGMFRANFEQFAGVDRVDRAAGPARLTHLTRPAAVVSVASLHVEATHDVLVVGAGCAGMRAAIEAHDAGADVGVISKLHPTRSHSGAAEGGINAALGNAAEDSPETHAFDTVKGSDYLGDQDAIEIFCQRGARRHLPARALGRGVLAPRRRQARAAPVRRRRLAAHRLRRRHHRPCAHPGALRAAGQARHQGLRGVLRLEARRERRPLPGRDRWDLLNGGLKTIGGKAVVLATGGQGRIYRDDDQRLRVHRRRGGDGAAPRAAAEGHGVHAVPPDDAVSVGILLTEGCRGEGAYLINSDGERFMKRYAPNALELASRDVVSRAEQTEIDDGRGIDGTSTSTCATSAQRGSSTACRARASSR